MTQWLWSVVCTWYCASRLQLSVLSMASAAGEVQNYVQNCGARPQGPWEKSMRRLAPPARGFPRYQASPARPRFPRCALYQQPRLRASRNCCDTVKGVVDRLCRQGRQRLSSMTVEGGATAPPWISRPENAAVVAAARESFRAADVDNSGELDAKV